jgi:ATP-dependent helicase/nuclease subunit B
VPAADGTTRLRLSDDLGWLVRDIDRFSATETGLKRLRRNLFKEEAAPAATGASTEIEIFSAPGEGGECIEIARRLLARAREGIPFDRIAVLLRSPEEYRANLEEAFDRAEVPVYFARGARRPDPAGRAFYALLKCAAEGLSARRFAEYLSLGQVSDATADGTPPPAAPRGDQWVQPEADAATPEMGRPEAGQVEEAAPAAVDAEQVPVREGALPAPWRWELLLVDAAVIGSRDRWRRRLDGLARELHAKLAQLSDEEEAAAAAVTRMIDDLAAFTGFALPLIDFIGGWPSSAIWENWLALLGDLATRALKAPERVLALLAELAPIAPVGPVGPVSLDEVIEVLAPLLLERAVPPTE